MPKYAVTFLLTGIEREPAMPTVEVIAKNEEEAHRLAFLRLLGRATRYYVLEIKKIGRTR